MSPIVMIPGNSLTGYWYTRHGFKGELDRKKLVNYALTFEASPNQTSRGNNAADLSRQLPKIATAYGVDGLHLVMHSKGGLDARQYLATFYRRVSGQPRILSYCSLSTPHDGSVLADLMVGHHRQAKIRAQEVEYENIAGWGLVTNLVAANLYNANDGYPHLMIADLASFNRSNLPQLPRNVIYGTIGADMDLNATAAIETYFVCNSARTEMEEMSWDEAVVEVTVVNGLYTILRNTGSMAIQWREGIVERVLPGGDVLTRPITIARMIGTSIDPVGNDVLVSLPSAAGADGGFSAIATRYADRLNCGGRNHCSIGNVGQIADVLSGVRNAESQYGDLTP